MPQHGPQPNLSSPPAGNFWHALIDQGTGYLSFYYSDPLARYPVRELTKPADNKSDPNIETATYGLFSTCEPGMRNCIVRDGAATIFFVTPHRGRARAVSGYYQVGWYAIGERGETSKDWALAARAARFVDPIPLTQVADAAPEAKGWFRTQRRLCADSVKLLRTSVDAKPDLTNAYVDELRRIERFAKSRTGFAYPSWGRTGGFTPEDGPSFLSAGTGGAPNSTATGQWLCANCHKIVPNRALLRRCPACQDVGTLTPFVTEQG